MKQRTPEETVKRQAGQIAKLKNEADKLRKRNRELISTLEQIASVATTAASGSTLLGTWGSDLDSSSLLELLAAAWHYERAGKSLTHYDKHVIDLHVYRYFIRGAKHGKER